MNLQTKLILEKKSNHLIDYQSDITLLGSCFSENIGNKLEYFKFKTTQNPFGILFHPKAIETLIINAIERKEYTYSDVFFNNEYWFCFDTHSKLSNTVKDTLLHQLNAQIDITAAKLKTASHIIITLGTAWVYRDVKTNTIVANCHKVSQKQFRKELLSVNAISEMLQQILKAIKRVNTEASLIFTVSPVRHIKDGIVENTRSKAHLISGIHDFLFANNIINTNSCYYFPSYEIMMDELRDYRFYKEDMLHPSALAIAYIWDIFKNVWIANESYKTMDIIENIQKDIAHKPLRPNSKAHFKFLENLEIKKQTVTNQFSHISF